MNWADDVSLREDTSTSWLSIIMEFLQVFIIILYENPDIFPMQVSLSPEQSTLKAYNCAGFDDASLNCSS
jgi:hypothetical protein